MKHEAIEILDSHRTMAISTVRPGGWPQTTIVGYANEGFDLFFLILRSSQKFANISRDDRISVAVGAEPRSLDQVQAVYAAAHATEITDPRQREYAWGLLVRRHPNLAEFEPPDASETALMRASCEHVSVVDYNRGFWRREDLAPNEARPAEQAVRRTEAVRPRLSADEE